MEKKFNLLIKLKNKTPFTLEVIDHILVGRDPRSDVVLTDKNASLSHFEFEQIDGTLVLKYHGTNKHSYLNKTALEKNKNYILEEKDLIKNNEIEIEFLKVSVRLQSAHALTEDEHAGHTMVGDTNQMLNLKKLLSQDEAQNIKNEIDLDLDFDSDSEKIETPKVPKKKKYIEKTKIIKVAKKEATKTNLKQTHFYAIKFLSLLIDFSFVYFLLTSVLSHFDAHVFVIDLTQYLFSLIDYNTIYALFYVLLPWIFLSLFQVLIFGVTLGQFLVGLKMDDSNSVARMLKLRIKMIFATIFLIPAQNDYYKNKFFTFTRYILSPLLIVLFIMAPFHLPNYTTINVSEAALISNYNANESHTLFFDKSNNLYYQISNKLIMLPTLTNEAKVKKAIVFKDLKKKTEASLVLIKSFKNSEIIDYLKYANPLYEIFHHHDDDDIYFQVMRALVQTPESFSQEALTNGPFIAGSYIFKKTLAPVEKAELTRFNNKKWLHIRGIGEAELPEEYFIYFSANALHLFKLKSENLSQSSEFFIESIMANGIKAPEINSEEISLIDSLKIKNSESLEPLLTYYTNIVNKLEHASLFFGNENLTLEAKTEISHELARLKERSSVFETKAEFQQLINKLSPMETPGGNDE